MTEWAGVAGEGRGLRGGRVGVAAGQAACQKPTRWGVRCILSEAAAHVQLPQTACFELPTHTPSLHARPPAGTLRAQAHPAAGGHGASEEPVERPEHQPAHGGGHGGSINKSRGVNQCRQDSQVGEQVGEGPQCGALPAVRGDGLAQSADRESGLVGGLAHPAAVRAAVRLSLGGSAAQGAACAHAPRGDHGCGARGTVCVPGAVERPQPACALSACCWLETNRCSLGLGGWCGNAWVPETARREEGRRGWAPA